MPDTRRNLDALRLSLDPDALRTKGRAALEIERFHRPTLTTTLKRCSDVLWNFRTAQVDARRYTHLAQRNERYGIRKGYYCCLPPALLLHQPTELRPLHCGNAIGVSPTESLGSTLGPIQPAARIPRSADAKHGICESPQAADSRSSRSTNTATTSATTECFACHQRRLGFRLQLIVFIVVVFVVVLIRLRLMLASRDSTMLPLPPNTKHRHSDRQVQHGAIRTQSLLLLAMRKHGRND